MREKNLNQDLEIKFELERERERLQREKEILSQRRNMETKTEELELNLVDSLNEHKYVTEKAVEKLMGNYEDESYSNEDFENFMKKDYEKYKTDSYTTEKYNTEEYETENYDYNMEDEYDGGTTEKLERHTEFVSPEDLNNDYYTEEIEEDDEFEEEKTNVFGKYYNYITWGIIGFLSVVMVILIMILNSQQKEIAENKKTNSFISDTEVVNTLTTQKNELEKENQNLRDELASLLSGSGAELGSENVAENNNENVTIVDEQVPLSPVENTIPESHVVVKGDTLMNIAKRYYGNPSLYKLIAEANNLSSEEIIIGETIIIPKI